MGMSPYFVSLVRQFAPHGAKAVSLGYPDFIRTPGKREPSAFLWKEIAADLHIIDVVAFRGMEEVVDLNEPLPGHLVGRFDLLINPGTYEHVFNIGQAVLNGYHLLKPGGIGVHTGPIQRGKHGFWNINEEALLAFYEAQGGAALHYRRDGKTFFAVTRNGGGWRKWPQEAGRTC